MVIRSGATHFCYFGVPHGVFNPQDFPDVIYTGASIELQLLPPVLFEVLTQKARLRKVRFTANDCERHDKRCSWRSCYDIKS
ncbi:MAG: hypothetical protein KME05_10270 [Gloeocapsa sp. UFS-A4-WI-NPMV-4B04]|nr:hypothetical protein [Gloeocapsa sp. UFS-A4-WI-NPMV-4B04]